MQEQSKRLGTDSIGSLMVRLSVPAFIGMFVAGMYNIVDTIFVSRGVGSIGVAALTIAFPIQMILMAMAAMFGIGGSSIISRSLGAGKQKEANDVYHQVITLVLFSSIVLAIMAFIFIDPLLNLFGATPTIHIYAKQFTQLILVGSIFQTFSMAMNNIVRSEGNARTAMGTMLISAILNMILNPIFIMGFGWGIRGSATATIISQAVGAAWLLFYFLSGKSSLTLKGFKFKFNGKIIKEIIGIGFPSFVMMSAGSIVTAVVNWMLKIYGGDSAIAVYGIINRVASFMLMPMNGVTQGMQPIVGFNFGAGQIKRVIKAVKLSMIVATIISTIAWLISQLFPQILVLIFSSEPDIVAMSNVALKINLICAPVIGFQVVCGGLFQALGKAKLAFIISVMRQIICLIPLLLILPKSFGLNGVWWAFPLSDVGGFLVCATILLLTYKNLFTKWDNTPKVDKM